MNKYKNKIVLALIALIVMSAYIFITTWQSSTYKEVHVMYPLEKSKNPQASEEFLKAMEYRIYIKQLHPFFDYDSFIMAPFLEKLAFHFQRGKALLPKESVEDIVWWTLFYKEIYGLLIPPRNDNSLAYENLPPQEFAKAHDAVYEMIVRYPEGEVYFDIPEIEQFRFKAMAILVGFYYGDYPMRYVGATPKDKAKKYATDFDVLEKLKEITEKYHLTYKKFIAQTKNKEFMEVEYISDIIAVQTTLIAHYTFVNNTQRLPSKICHSENVDFMLEHIKQILDYIDSNKNHQSRYLEGRFFNDNSNFPVVLKLLEYRCPNLHPEISQIVHDVEQFNKTRKQ